MRLSVTKYQVNFFGKVKKKIKNEGNSKWKKIIEGEITKNITL
jgi:hypothetical protein